VPADLAAGVITSIIAAPYFLYLLHRANRLGATG
jgi:ABC-type Fe3+-siderophore transport system permease subunit